MKFIVPAETWFTDPAITSVDGQYAVRILSRQPDPLDNLFKGLLLLAVLTIDREPKCSRAGFLRATVNLVGAAPSMARALDAALQTGALAQHPEAENAARAALRLTSEGR